MPPIHHRYISTVVQRTISNILRCTQVHYFSIGKKNFAFFGAAIVILIVVVLIGKPLIIGEPMPFLSSSDPSDVPNAPTPTPKSRRPIPKTTETPLPTPTSIPMWDGKVKTADYVGSSTHHIESPKMLTIGDQPTKYQRNRI